MFYVSSSGYHRLLSRRLTSILISASDFLWDLYKALARMMLGLRSFAPGVGKRPSSKSHQTEYGYVQTGHEYFLSEGQLFGIDKSSQIAMNRAKNRSREICQLLRECK